MNLTVEQPGKADLRVFGDGELIAEIASLGLTFGRFRPGGRSFISSNVPLPLYWMQYANHEDPERNAGSNGELNILECRAERLTVECLGSTRTGACRSRMALTISLTGPPVLIEYAVDATLEVVSPEGWLVTPNQHHGEVEFCNLWPEGTFVTTAGAAKRYQSCHLVQGESVLSIPHHHLESSDKHNIPLGSGDRFLWLLEDENPCLTLVSDHSVTAGVCAYMWDAHFALKICHHGRPVFLSEATRFNASYSLTGLDREAGAKLLRASHPRPAPGSEQIPVYVDGVNRFTDNIADHPADSDAVWPWETESDGEGEPLFVLDQENGFDDSASLRIETRSHCSARWRFTALGPAYGRPPYADGSRFRLTAYVETRDLAGNAAIALRLHREGAGNLFRVGEYDLYRSDTPVSGNRNWCRVEVLTPPISPAPDRVHILLNHDGEGVSWFDNVLLEVLR